MFSVGSGATYAYGVMDSGYKFVLILFSIYLELIS